MTLLTYTLAPDVTSAPARPRPAPWVSHTVSAVVLAAAGLLGTLAGVLHAPVDSTTTKSAPQV